MNKDPMKNDDKIILQKKPDRSRVYTFVVIVCSLLCSVLFWLYVLGYDSPNFEKTFRQISVTVIGEEELREEIGYTLLDELKTEVDITISGKRTVINKLYSDDIEVYVDVSQIRSPGRTELEILVHAPNGTELVDKNIESVSVFIDKYIETQIPVEAKITSAVMNDDLSLGENFITPATVRVRGPESILEKIDNALALVDLGEVSNSKIINASVALRNNELPVDNPYVHLIDSTVNIHTTVYKTRNLEIKVNFIGGVLSTSNAIITMNEKYITVKGKLEEVDALTDIEINIDETKIRQSTKVIKKLELPEGIENISEIDSIEVDVSLNEMGVREILADMSKVTFENVPEDFDVELFTESIKVTFVGLVDALFDLGPENFEIVIDLKDINLVDNQRLTLIDTVINVIPDENIPKLSVYAVSPVDIIAYLKIRE